MSAAEIGCDGNLIYLRQIIDSMPRKYAKELHNDDLAEVIHLVVCATAALLAAREAF